LANPVVLLSSCVHCKTIRLIIHPVPAAKIFRLRLDQF
jgi:hypothetical protein